jgi:hypothetical protein
MVRDAWRGVEIECLMLQILECGTNANDAGKRDEIIVA